MGLVDLEVKGYFYIACPASMRVRKYLSSANYGMRISCQPVNLCRSFITGYAPRVDIRLHTWCTSITMDQIAVQNDLNILINTPWMGNAS